MLQKLRKNAPKLTKLEININKETKITVKKMYSQRRVSKGSRKAHVLNDSCLRVTKLKPVSRYATEKSIIWEVSEVIGTSAENSSDQEFWKN